MQLAGPYLLKVAIDSYLVAQKDALGLSLVALAFALTLLIAWGSQAVESYTMAPRAAPNSKPAFPEDQSPAAELSRSPPFGRDHVTDHQ